MPSFLRMSYAIAAANGSSKEATEIELSTELAKTAIADSPVESAGDEDKTPSPKSEKNSKPKDKSTKQDDAELEAEKIKKSLAPAPVPVVNAWGSSIPSAAIDEIVKTKDDILTAASRENSKSSSKPAAAKQGKEKWVPFKAAVVLPAAPKPVSSKSQKKNKKKVKDQSNKQNRKKTPIKQQQHQQQAQIKGSDENNKKLDKKQPNGTSTESAVAPIATPLEFNEQQTATAKAVPPQVPQQDNLDQVEQPISTSDDHQHEQSQQNLHAHHNHQNNHKPYRQFNNGYRKYQGRQQYNNNNGVFIPFNNRQQHPQGFHGFIPAYSPNAFHPRPFQPIYPQQAAAFAAQDPLPSLTYQLDYYFSLENLVKDIYLRKQMNSQGFIPLTVIFNFFRVNALSSGNYHLVVDALKYCMNIESRGSDNGIKIRALNDWEKWVLPFSQREESGKDESVPEPVSEIIQTEVEASTST